MTYTAVGMALPLLRHTSHVGVTVSGVRCAEGEVATSTLCPTTVAAFWFSSPPRRLSLTLAFTQGLEFREENQHLLENAFDFLATGFIYASHSVKYQEG